MSSPDADPPPPLPQEDRGRNSGGGPGCMVMGVASVMALFISVVGLCGGGGPPGNARIGIFFIFLALAAILFVAAIIIGVYKLFSSRH
jgi:hypothetical protein